MAKVKVTPEALADLAKLPRPIRERIGKLFQRLEQWPAVSGVKSLSGNLAGLSITHRRLQAAFSHFARCSSHGQDWASQ
jgi:mRNA-degrading endonuclease RelE of RelBE toxin-antitoxin system